MPLRSKNGNKFEAMTVTNVNILKRPGFAMLLRDVVTGGILGLFVLVAVLGISPATAQTSSERDIFTVLEVPVDATATNVTEAREQGLLAGRMAAFWKVINRLVAPEDIERVPQPSAGEVITMVRDFSVSGERSSAVRYLADMSVRFHPGPIRSMLRAADVPFTETVSKPLVVVPLFRESAGARLLLWEDPNPWRMAWMGPAADNGLVPFVLPLGDIGDLTTLSMEETVAGNETALADMATRYNTGGTLVAVAEVSADNQTSSIVPGDVNENVGPGEVINVLLTLTARHRDLPTSQMVLSYAGEPGEELDDVLSAAADAAAAAVQNVWKTANRVAFNSTNQITALVPVSGLEQWVGIQNQLEDVPLIERVNLQAMTRDRAQVNLVYAGNIEQIKIELAQKDLAITDEGGVWVIDSLLSDAAGGVELSNPSDDSGSVLDDTLQ